MHDPDQSLDLLLSEWQARGDVPTSLQREVWASVAAGAADPGWWDSLLLALLRPRVLSLAAAAAVAVGARTTTMTTMATTPTMTTMTAMTTMTMAATMTTVTTLTTMTTPTI